MSRRKKGLPLNGWINLDKPYGMASTDAVNRVRRLLGAQKAGHGGTLDPLATGILPIALGEATKILPYVTDSHKDYRFTVTWGEQRDTDDLEGAVIATSDVRPTPDQITAILPRFIGNILQLPPKYSAIKIDGERAYDLARGGVEFELKPRPVFIESLTLEGTTPDTATFFCRCGKGTYVRSLARDFAHLLETKGYVSALRRTAVGCLNEANAISLDKLEALVAQDPPQPVLLPLQTALDDIPALALKSAEAAQLKNGQPLTLAARVDVERLVRTGLDPRTTSDTLALAVCDGALVALLSVEGPVLHPVRVFNL